MAAEQSLEMVNVKPNCRKCGSALTIEEIHYYDNGDGTATCNDCEEKWLNDVSAWKNGELDAIPER